MSDSSSAKFTLAPDMTVFDDSAWSVEHCTMLFPTSLCILTCINYMDGGIFFCASCASNRQASSMVQALSNKKHEH